MKYDIYFHNDFDGRASAAVVLDFLKSRGDSIVRWIPVDHNDKRWDAKKLPSKHPAIVVDFPYHPDARFWFDHHETAFKKPEWRKKFKQTKYCAWDPKAPSAAGLIVKSLKKNFGYRPPRHIVELAQWLDVTDAANFRSAKQAIEKKEPALQIEEFIDEKKGKQTLLWLIRAMSARPFSEIVRKPEIQRTMRQYAKKKTAILRFYRTMLRVTGRLGFIDISGGQAESRFAPYYLYPGLVYALTLKKDSKGRARLSFNANAWRRKENKIHLGAYLQKEFGGGGHHDAGGVTFTSRKSAEQAAKKIIKHFA